MLTHHIIRTSGNVSGESPRTGAIHEDWETHSPVPAAMTVHPASPRPDKDFRQSRPVGPIATLGCVVSIAMVGCCLLAGVAGLAVAGFVLVATALAVGRTLVQLKQCDVPEETVPPEHTRDLGRPAPTALARADREPVTTDFWHELNTDERRAFMSRAQERSFAGGATLVREGEIADHVILIRSGWTKICVDERGRQRVIAERGPGQLVGERAALQVNVRSASVVALETVRALVLRTEDFAEFVGAHPRVLDIIEGQVYDRLTTPLAECRHECHHVGTVRTQERAAVPPSFNGENCTIVLTDVAGFGARVRNDDDRLVVRHELLATLTTAFTESGIPWDSCHSEDRGDGLLIVIPPSIPTKAVVDGLPGRLAEALRRHNRRSSDPVRIQLRLAVDVGPVVSDEAGLSGESIIWAARLLDAPILKRTLADTSADLGVIISGFVYESVVKHVAPDGFRSVRVKVKESRLDAWMRLIGGTAS